MSKDDMFIKELQKEFLDQVVFMLDECEESYLKLDKPAAREEELTKIFRLAHSIKGSGGVAGYLDLAAFAHCVEDLLTLLRARPDLVNAATISLLLRVGDAFKKRIAELQSGDQPPWDVEALKQEILSATNFLNSDEPQMEAGEGATDKVQEGAPAVTATKQAAPTKAKEASLVRVDPVRIDAVLDLVGELVVIKSQLLEQHAKDTNSRGREILELFDKTARELQDRTLAMRLTALRPLFVRMQRVVHDLALQLEKPIDFVMTGDDIELDRSMIELLTDPLTHIVRNAIDHGLEEWDEREGLGKPISGQISLSARQSGGRIVIELKDDGRGIDRNKVLKRAIERNLVSEAQGSNMTNDEVYQLLFLAGFSTAEKITDVSGRGVGLDVVKSNVEKLKGSVIIESQFGKGSVFRISVPLTTTIADGIIILVDGQRFIVPMSSILEIVSLDEKNVHQMTDQQSAAMIRDRAVTLLDLQDVLQMARQITGESETHAALSEVIVPAAKKRVVLVIEHLRVPLALVVDSVVGQSQVVVKALGDCFKDTVGLAGACVMGDGKIALVLDVDALASRVKMKKTPLVESEIPMGKVG